MLYVIYRPVQNKHLLLDDVFYYTKYTTINYKQNILTLAGITTVPEIAPSNATKSTSSLSNAPEEIATTTLAAPTASEHEKSPQNNVPAVLVVDATEKSLIGPNVNTTETATAQKFAAAVNDSASLAKIKPVLMAMNGVTDDNVDELIAHIIDAQPEIKGRALNLSVPAVGHDAAAEVSDNGMPTSVEMANYVTTTKPAAMRAMVSSMNMKDLSDVSMDDDMDMMGGGGIDDVVDGSAASPEVESTQPRQINGSIVAATAESAEHTMNDCESNGKTYKVSVGMVSFLTHSYTLGKT